jgi:deoxyribodipyrimidine photo-lyase
VSCRPAGAALALFTADLRVRDNLVLHAALRGADEVVPLFVLDPRVRAAGFDAPNRRAFLVDRLGALDGELRERGGRLVVRGDDSAHAGCGVSPCARRTGDGA